MKYTTLNDGLYEYLTSMRSGADDPVLRDLRRETDSLGEIRRMQISPEQGSFLGILAASISAQSAIEVGTFTGYSSICIARGLSSGGKLLCLDESREWTEVAQRYWQRAGVSDRIELRLGAAVAALEKLEPEWTFDFAFVDADKEEYDRYYKLILPRVRKNGLILFDNMLWGGRLTEKNIREESGRAIDRLNRKLAADSRVETVLLAVADGIQVCRKK